MEKRGLFMFETQVKYLFNGNILIYSFAGLLGLGIVIRSILYFVYIHMVNQTDNMPNTKRKSLKQMKLKFETCYQLMIGVHNVDIFVDKTVFRFKFCGIRLSTWENFSGQILLLNFLLVPILAVSAVYYQCGQADILRVGAVGILSSSTLVLVDKMINLTLKKQMLRINLVDYFDNTCKAKLDWEVFHPEKLEQYQNAYFDPMAEDINLGSYSPVGKEVTKKEITRRKEARQRKEEEKRLKAQEREEEAKRLEEVRREEEMRRLEERNRQAAKRREEEMQQLLKERETLELRRAKMKKKTEEKLQQVLMNQKLEERHHQEGLDDEFQIDLSEFDEAAAAKEREDMELVKDKQWEEKIRNVIKGRTFSAEEEKLIQDVLKDFFS